MENEKPAKEESTIEETPQRWCSICNNYVNVKGKKKNICVNCGAFTAKIKPESKSEEKRVPTEKGKKDYRLTTIRPTNLSGAESAEAEVLINAGFAKNFQDLVKKGIDEMYQRKMFFGQQLNPQEKTKIEETKMEEPNPEKSMKQIQEQEIMAAYAQKLRGDSESSPQKTMAQLQEQNLVEAYIGNMNKGNQADPLQLMMMMRMMDNKEQGKNSKDNGLMDKMLEIQMLKSVMGGGNSETASLSREITDLKHQIATNQLLQQSQGGKTPFQDQLMAMEKIRADKETGIRKAEIEAQKERDKSMKILLDTRLKEMEKSVDDAKQGGSFGTQRAKEFKEEISAIKEMSKELGEREKGAGEYIGETITNVATQLQPAFTKMMEQKQQQPPPQEMPPAQMPQEMPDIQNPKPSELTSSEKEMSDTMSDMYIDTPNEKKPES